jgi:hypothetical protein
MMKKIYILVICPGNTLRKKKNETCHLPRKHIERKKKIRPHIHFRKDAKHLLNGVNIKFGKNAL